MKIHNNKIIIGATFFSSLVLAGCNNGSSSTPQSGVYQQSRVIRTHKIVHHTNTAYEAKRLIKKNNVQSKEEMLKQEKIIFKSALTDGNGASPIGWNSVTNTLAPANCYNYTADYAPLTTGSKSTLYVNNQASSFYQNIGVNVSYSGAMLSAAADASVTLSSQQAGGLVVLDSRVERQATFSDISLNAYGQSLQDNPEEFVNQCGDAILQQANIFISLSATSSVTSSSSLDSIFASISGSYGEQGFDQFAAAISSKTQTASSSISINTTLEEYGSLYNTDFSNLGADIAECFPQDESTPANSANCNEGVSEMASTVNSADSNIISLISGNNNLNQWANYYVIDYSNSSIQTEKASTVVPALKFSNPAFQPYLSAIKNNMNVLEDLTAANNFLVNGLDLVLYDFSQQANNQNGDIYSSTWFQNAFGYNLGGLIQDPYIRTISEFKLYNLTQILDTQNTSGYAYIIYNCVNSINSSDIDTNCSKLPKSPTINSIVNQYYPATINAYAGTPGTSNFVSRTTLGLVTTINDLMYKVSINTVQSAAQNGSGDYQLTQGNMFNGAIIALPLAQKSGNNAVILAIPMTPYIRPANYFDTNRNAYITNFLSVGAFEVINGTFTSITGISGAAQGFFPTLDDNWSPNINVMVDSQVSPQNSPIGLISGDGNFGGLLVSTYIFNNSSDNFYELLEQHSTGCNDSNFGAVPSCIFNWTIYSAQNSNNNAPSVGLNVIATPTSGIFHTIYPGS